jgi:hypothetical protein
MNGNNNESEIGRKKNTYGEVWIGDGKFSPPSYHQNIVLFQVSSYLFLDYSMMNLRWFDMPDCWICRLWKD